MHELSHLYTTRARARERYEGKKEEEWESKANCLEVSRIPSGIEILCARALAISLRSRAINLNKAAALS
jgi:hypothetical protein